MRQYLDTLRLVLDQGTWLESRTGIRRVRLPGISLRFDLAAGSRSTPIRAITLRNGFTGLSRQLSRSKAINTIYRLPRRWRFEAD